RALLDQADGAVAPDLELLDAAQTRDQAGRARRPPEAVRLERIRERVDADRPLGRACEKLPGHREELVVRRGMGLALEWGVVPRRWGVHRRWRPTVMPTPAAPSPATGAGVPRLLHRLLPQLLAGDGGERTVRETVELYAEARRDVSHRVEGLVVGDDLDDVARARGSQPDPRGHRDAKVAPVAHADRRGAVHEESAAFCQHARSVVV